MRVLDPLTLPADDRGVLLGDGLFETVRLYGGRPFRLEAHLGRMEAAAELLGIAVPAELRGRIRSALDGWGEQDGALRVTLTRGTGRGLIPPDDPEPRLLLAIDSLPAPLPPEEVIGLTGRTLGRVDENGLVSGLKVLGYAERIQALRLARGAGADEALLRNSLGELVEGSASNVIAVRERRIVSPGRVSGALPGITRSVMIEIAAAAGLDVEERGLAPEELDGLDELILTSSLRELAPVVEVNGRPIGSGTPGEIFLSLLGAFRETVSRELADPADVPFQSDLSRQPDVDRQSDVA